MIIFCVPDILLGPGNIALIMMWNLILTKKKKKSKQKLAVVEIKPDEIVARQLLGTGE